MQQQLDINNLHVSIDETPILKGVDVTVRPGEVHAIMGPNGSGKSTLALTLAGHPRYAATKGAITLNGNDLTESEPAERAKEGLFLAFQYPSEVAGVKLFNFLWTAYKAVKEEDISAVDFLAQVKEKAALLDMETSFLERSVNDGFSGGEKKKAEMLQMLALAPQYAIMDETDSGLDVDALRTVATAARTITQGDTPAGIVVITHYQRILEHIQPDHVHVMLDGAIVESGGPELAQKLETEGYSWLMPGNAK